MTVAAGSIVNSYTGTGASNNFAFTFPVLSQGDIAIVVTSPTGTKYNLILGTDYTVSTLNPAGGPPTTGSITLVNSSQAWLTTGNLTSGWSISLTRNMSIAQLTSIRNQGDFYQEVLEQTLDYLTMLCQQINQAISPVIPISLAVVTGDITISTAGSGVILTDQATGLQYRVMVQNGVLGIQPLP